MNNEIIITEKAGEIADIATRKSLPEADAMLMSVAEEGDAFALEVFKKIPHDVKAKLVGEGDFSKPTFSGLLSSPEEVVNIFVADPSIWFDVSDLDIDEVMSQIRIMCTSLILSHESDKWFEDVFQFISEDEDAVLYLATAFIGCVERDMENDEFYFSFDKSQYGHGEISHIQEMLHQHAPKLERQVAEVICGYGESWTHSNIIVVLNDLYDRAKAQALSEVEEDAQDMAL